MSDALVLLLRLLTSIAKLLGPGGARAVVAETLFVKRQLLVLNLSHRKAPNLSALDRFLFGFWSQFLSPHRILRVAVIIKPSTLLKFHEALKKHKYRLLFSSCGQRGPVPKGPSQELIHAIVEMKRRTPRFGCTMIAQQISRAFGFEISKDVEEIKTVPYTPVSHPFVERLIGSIRREYLDQVLFWNIVDLERKLSSFQRYYNHSRTHASLDGNTPAEIGGDRVAHTIMLDNFTWEKHCGGLFEPPMAA